MEIILLDLKKSALAIRFLAVKKGREADFFLDNMQELEYICIQMLEGIAPITADEKKAQNRMNNDDYSNLVLPEAEHLERAADILRTVAHPARLRIIDFLEGGEKAVAEICRHLDAPQPYISQHLNLMKAKAILSSRRNGTQILYSIANKNVVKVIHCVRRHAKGSARAEGACIPQSEDEGS
ncbi:MAG: ArsR/SmtB family transcription factor [Syntrophobacteraceae bacterium]